MQPTARVARLRRWAELAIAEAPWTRFPGIGKPGAERIALFTGTRAVLALDSNALRVLVRLGYGDPDAAYATTYRQAQTQASTSSPRRCRRGNARTSCCAATGRRSAEGPRRPAHAARWPTTAPARPPPRDTGLPDELACGDAHPNHRVEVESGSGRVVGRPTRRCVGLGRLCHSYRIAGCGATPGCPGAAPRREANAHSPGFAMLISASPPRSSACCSRRTLVTSAVAKRRLTAMSSASRTVR